MAWGLAFQEARFVISTAVAKERPPPQVGQKIAEDAVLPSESGASWPLTHSRHLKMVITSLFNFLLCVCVLCVAFVHVSGVI